MTHSLSEDADPLSLRCGLFSLQIITDAEEDFLLMAPIADAVLPLVDTYFNAQATLNMSLKLCDDEKIQEFNNEFRNKDKATNILSFPDGTEDENGIYLGDMLLSIETLAREATQQDKPINNHAAHLLLHGILHLMGYDHESDEEAEEMEALETELLKVIDIPSPYIDVVE